MSGGVSWGVGELWRFFFEFDCSLGLIVFYTYFVDFDLGSFRVLFRIFCFSFIVSFDRWILRF